jgi:hypothetical protein
MPVPVTDAAGLARPPAAARPFVAAGGVLAAAAGRLLAVPLAAFARRRHGKPMHPRGTVVRGVLDRYGARPPCGVPWLDVADRASVTVRLSRGAGLPPPWPDLLGLAVRVPGEDGDVDLLLSTTGSGSRTRLLPVLRRDAATGYGSIMGYRSRAGTLRLGAFAERTHGPGDRIDPDGGPAAGGGLVFVLAAARGTGPWRPFARLTLADPVDGGDADVRFDAVRRPPPGMVPDGPLARLRAPSYAAAQRARGG